MGILSKVISKQKGKIEKLIAEYMTTFIFGIAVCIFWLVSSDGKFDTNDLFQSIMRSLAFIVPGAFLTDTIFNKVNKRNVTGLIIGHTVGVVISIILGTSSVVSVNDFLTYYMPIFAACYVITCIFLGIFFTIKNLNKNFNQYVQNTVFKLAQLALVMLTVNIGLLFLLWIFNILIFKFNIFELVEKIEIIMAGVLYLPSFVLAITDEEDTNTKFVKVFVNYLLMSMVLIATGIIYIYIFKLIATKQFPSNEVFAICATLFCVGAVIWTMAKSNIIKDLETRRKTLFNKITLNMKYIYAPFILLEIYCIGVRISQYGVTSDRYVGVVFIVFQLIYVFWDIFAKAFRKITKSKKTGEMHEGLIIVLIIIMFTSTLVPFINMEYVSYISQKNEFEAIYPPKEGSARRLNNIYSRLRYNYYGEEYLEENYTDAELEQIELLAREEYYDTNSGHGTYVRYAMYLTRGIQIDIEGYEKLDSVDHYSYDKIEWSEIENYMIELKDEYFHVDLSEAVIEVMGRVEEYEDEPLEIIIDENRKLVIIEFTFRYSKEENKLESINVDGYLLSR